MRNLHRGTSLTVALVVVLSGCAQRIPEDALQWTPESLEQRQRQTRRFESKDEQALLSAGAAVLQDVGFQIDASEIELGVITASKKRSAVEAGQVVASLFFAAIFGAALPWDKEQKLRASLVTRPAGEHRDSTLVRVTFQRIVWNTSGQVSRTETLDDPKFYQDFFQKLSKAVFLDAHEL